MVRTPELFTHSHYVRRELGDEEISVEEVFVKKALPPQRHDEILLIYCKRGSGVLTVNGVDLPFRSGMLARLFPFHIYSIASADGNPLELFRCAFSLSIIIFLDIGKRNDEATHMLLESASPVVSAPELVARRVCACMEEMIEEFQTQEDFYPRLVTGGLMKILGYFDRQAAIEVRNSESQTRPLAWKILQFIHVHFNARDMESSMVAQQFGVSATRLEHILRALTGQGFAANLHEVRIRNVCAMMCFEELTVSYISRFVGYTSSATFHRAFKQITGVTPNQYKKGLGIGQTGAQRDTAWKIIVYLLENYAENLKPADVAKKLFVGEATLHNILRSSIDLSFAQLLEQIRLTYACALLGTGRLRVCDVAEAVGYNSARTFSRSFRKVLGATPSQYRSRL